VSDTAAAEALTLQDHVPDDKRTLLLVAVPLESFFLVQSIVALSGLSWPLPFFRSSIPA
jgi:hypothetical protein